MGAFAQWLEEKRDEHEPAWMDAEPSIAGRRDACTWALALAQDNPPTDVLLAGIRAKAAEYERTGRTESAREAQVYAAMASATLEAAARWLAHEKLETDLQALLDGRVRRCTWPLGDWDDHRSEIAETQRWLEERLGPPSDLPGELGGLDIDLTRCVRVICWQRGTLRVVAGLTTHDGGSLTYLELRSSTP